ncbi:DUF1403 family protein [Methylosinus sp. Ce-a6]|uniref:DUF1403 family protein n=1 Tax=Methylosinus sp. Ce-a6 TaxID=2172005 RepID=UPI00135AD4B3
MRRCGGVRRGGGRGPAIPIGRRRSAGAVALAASKALALAAELARRAETLQSVAPRLRARGAKRVIALLLDEDAVSAARAARELTGRSSFRLYGL